MSNREQREDRLVEIGMEVVRGILDEQEGKLNCDTIRRRSDRCLAHRLTGRPQIDYETESLQLIEHDVPALLDALRKSEARVSSLAGALREALCQRGRGGVGER